MAPSFLDIARTPSVIAAETANGSAALSAQMAAMRQGDRFTEVEAAFIAERDSFYLATASETGWPYVQHRGGPKGFLKVLDDRTLAFADYRGNRQYLSLGNLAANDRAALILVDYPNRTRLKLFARMKAVDLGVEPELARQLETPGYRARPERVFLLSLEAFDWNCPQHITPRYTEAELEPILETLRRQIRTLEAENRALKAQRPTEG